MTKVDKRMINYLDYEGTKFPVSKKDYCKIERQNNVCINVFCYEKDLTYLVYVSDQKFHDFKDLLLISNENKSHYVYIKDSNRFMCNKTKNKNKKYFCKCCLQCFSSGKILAEHGENCLIRNGKQIVKLKIGSISFENHFKQLPVPFKMYADFECILKGAKSSDKNSGSYTKNIKITFLVVLLRKLHVFIINIARKLLFTEEKMLLTDLLKQFLKIMIIVKK